MSQKGSYKGFRTPGSGRKSFEPAEADRSLVLALRGAGFSNESIASQIGPRGIDNKTLTKHFAHELAIGLDRINGICVTGLVKQMQEGNLGALCFWAKTRMGWRETQKLEVSGSLSIIDAILDAGSDPER